MATKRGLYKRGGVWWLRTDPVTGKPISTRCKSEKAAELFLEERERLSASPAYAASLHATLGDWCDKYVAAREEHGLSSAYARQKLGAILSTIPRETPLADIHPEAVDAYISSRRAEGITSHTLTKEIGQLRLVMRHALRRGVWSGDPETLRPVTLRKGYKPRQRWLTPNEVDRLLAECSTELAAFVARCVSYSCRLTEVYVTTIDENGRAHIAGTKTARSARVVPLLPPFDRLGEAAKGTPHGPNNLRRDLLAACKRAKIARATANDLRRTFDSTLSEAGVPHAVIAAFMGHSGTQMTAGVYDWARLSELEQVARAAIQKRDSGAGDSADSTRATQDSNLRPSAPEAISGALDGLQDRPLLCENADLDEASDAVTWPRGAPGRYRSVTALDAHDLLGVAVSVLSRKAAA